MGAAKASVCAYPNPDVKLVLMFSGPFNYPMTVEKMGKLEKIGYVFSKFKLDHPNATLEKYSGINHFKPEGIVLTGGDEPTPNSERVFLSANMTDSLVHPQNTIDAIEKLNLPESNYRLYKSGGHGHEGNEWSLAVAIYKFIKERL